MTNNNNGENGRRSVITYFWQVLATVSSSALVGMFFWLWNVTIDIRDLQNGQQSVARISADLSIARSLIDRNSDRLTKLELTVEQNSTILKDVLRRVDDLRTENRETIKDLLVRIDKFGGALSANVESTIRMTETLRQVERNLQAHAIDERPSYRPLMPPPDERTP